MINIADCVSSGSFLPFPFFQAQRTSPVMEGLPIMEGTLCGKMEVRSLIEAFCFPLVWNCKPSKNTTQVYNLKGMQNFGYSLRIPEKSCSSFVAVVSVSQYSKHHNVLSQHISSPVWIPNFLCYLRPQFSEQKSNSHTVLSHVSVGTRPIVLHL